MNNIRKFPINVTSNAMNKIKYILKKTNNYGMLFTANSGGCNGFNYKLDLLNKDEFNKINSKNPSIINENLIIDPYVEMFLIGTTIDYVQEDLNKNIFENKFIFIPDKNLATSCGCGTSFSPKNI